MRFWIKTLKDEREYLRSELRDARLANEAFQLQIDALQGVVAQLESIHAELRTSVQAPVPKGGRKR